MKVRYVYLRWMKILLSHTVSTKAQEAVQLTHSPETLLPLENCLHTLQTKGVMEEQGGMTPHKTYRQILAQQEKRILRNPEPGLTEPQGTCTLDTQLGDGLHFSLLPQAFKHNRPKIYGESKLLLSQSIRGQLPCHSTSGVRQEMLPADSPF